MITKEHIQRMLSVYNDKLEYAVKTSNYSDAIKYEGAIEALTLVMLYIDKEDHIDI